MNYRYKLSHKAALAFMLNALVTGAMHGSYETPTFESKTTLDGKRIARMATQTTTSYTESDDHYKLIVTHDKKTGLYTYKPLLMGEQSEIEKIPEDQAQKKFEALEQLFNNIHIKKTSAHTQVSHHTQNGIETYTLTGFFPYGIIESRAAYDSGEKLYTACKISTRPDLPANTKIDDAQELFTTLKNKFDRAQ